MRSFDHLDEGDRGDEFRRTYHLDDELYDDARRLEVVVTYEGVIMDVWQGDEHLATLGMMGDEWAEHVEAHDPLAREGRQS